MSLFFELLREEWRIHSSIVGNASFALFAFIMLGLSLLFTFLAPIFLGIRNVLVFVHYLFFVFGMSVGAFGLGGREFLNRRFGEINFLAYSSRTLPLSIRTIFANFVVKDIAYYLAFMLAPFTASLALSIKLAGAGLSESLLIFISLPVAFTLGLGISFFLSTLYSRARIIVQSGLAILAGIIFVMLPAIINNNYYENILLPLNFYLNHSPDILISSIIIIAILITSSTLLFRFEHESKAKDYSTIFKKTKKHSIIKVFMIKDIIDLHRSEGSFGKVLFSFFIPLMIVEVMVQFLLKLFVINNNGLLLLFSVVIGVTASTIYNWLTEFDILDKYFILPVSDRMVITSKTALTLIIGIISGTLMVILSLMFLTATISILPLALLIFLSMFIYTTSVLIYLTGLNPNILLFDAKTFLKYIILLGPVIVILMYQSFSYPQGKNVLNMIIITVAMISVSILIARSALRNPRKFSLIS